MAIKSRDELKDVSAQEMAYERDVFMQAVSEFPTFTTSQKSMFRTDPDLKGSVFADLKDSDKQDLFAEKLGTDVLRRLSSNQTLHMIRNEAEHSLKRRGITKPLAVAVGRPLDVTNRRAFDHEGNRVLDGSASLGISYNEDQKELQDAVEARSVSPEDLGTTIRTHSIGDSVNKTLYFTDRTDIFALDAEVEFEHDGNMMGSAVQALIYEKARLEGDHALALRASEGPLSMEDLYKKGMMSSYNRTPEEGSAWSDNRTQITKDVLQSKFSGNDDAKEALVATKGYRLAYASPNKVDGIGINLEDISIIRKNAVRRNVEFNLKEKSPDTNNLLGRLNENIRMDLISPEVELPENYNPTSPYADADFAQSLNNEPADDNEYVGFSGYDPYMDDSYEMPGENTISNSSDNPFATKEPEKPAVVEQPAVAKNVERKPLEMSIHASQNLTTRGQSRAIYAIKRFEQEAIKDGRKAVVYVSEHASKELKKAVWSQALDNDSLSMAQLDMEHPVDRSLIVQHESQLSPHMVKELQYATRNSDSRDVRALSVDPLEPEMYAVNEHLVDISKKVTVQYENDGAELLVPEPVVDSDLDKVKKTLLASKKLEQQAVSQSKQRTAESNPAKGVYAENPFPSA